MCGVSRASAEPTVAKRSSPVRDVSESGCDRRGRSFSPSRVDLPSSILGAEGVQIGTRFALSHESSAHRMFKEHCTSLGEGGTRLLLKKISPTRLAYGSRFTETVEKMEAEGADGEELMHFLGKGRAKRGIFEGDINEGEIEIGQACSLVNSIESVEQIMKSLI